jgi:hypothetical protein
MISNNALLSSLGSDVSANDVGSKIHNIFYIVKLLIYNNFL